MDRIVVGVDGSEGGKRALRWAFAEARVRNAVLQPVLGWSYLDQHRPGDTEFRPLYSAAEAGAALDQILLDVAGPDPDVKIEPTVVNDLPAQALLEAAEGADLLVVGSRGLGGFRRLLLGSVSQHCAQHATCPVVIVPGERPKPT